MESAVATTVVTVGFFVAVVAVFAGVITLLVVLGRRQHRSRADLAALVDFAHQHGWSYQPSDTGAADRFAGGEPFPRWSRHLTVAHLVSGTYRQRGFASFEYQRRTPNPGRRSRTANQRPEHFQITAVRLPGHGPTLQVRRAGWGARVLDRLGAKGLTFDDPEFDEAFRVTGDDEAFAREVLTGGLRRWLLSDPRARDFPLRFERDELVTWRRGRLTAPAVQESLEFLSDVLDRVRAAAWQTLR